MHGKRAGGYSGRHNPVEVPRNMKTRIQGTAVVDARTLTPNPANWRTHPQAQLAALEGVLAEVGHVQHVIVNGRTGLIVDGHARVELAASRGDTVPVVYVDLSSEDEALVLATFDPLSAMAGQADALLADLLDQCQTDNPALQALLDSLTPALTFVAEGKTPDDTAPQVRPDPVTRPGDVWTLGPHRVMCGDSTSVDDVQRLVGCAGRAQLLHADPPYGMGKAAQGVANDNIYRDELDRFQLEWWATFRTFLAENASVYIWGNAPDLWRLWYKAGLGQSEELEIRNEIVWDKGGAMGMRSPDLTQYPPSSERCLFFQLGRQLAGTVNTQDFPPEWDPIFKYMEGEAKAAGITKADVSRVCGVGMFSHWFSRSQFNLMPEKHYAALAVAYPGRFTEEWGRLKAEWDKVKGAATARVQESRSFFDNTHEVMRDVWEFPRVPGGERHGHATPKPVAMMERVMRTSIPLGGVCLEPFGGSGSTLIGAEKTGRVCHTMELQARYCDVIVRRWQDFTGRAATLEGDGRTFAEIEAAGHAPQ